jgi:hypothetical protein
MQREQLDAVDVCFGMGFASVRVCVLGGCGVAEGDVVSTLSCWRSIVASSVQHRSRWSACCTVNVLVSVCAADAALELSDAALGRLYAAVAAAGQAYAAVAAARRVAVPLVCCVALVDERGLATAAFTVLARGKLAPLNRLCDLQVFEVAAAPQWHPPARRWGPPSVDPRTLVALDDLRLRNQLVVAPASAPASATTDFELFERVRDGSSVASALAPGGALAVRSRLPSELLDMIGRKACTYYATRTLAQVVAERATPLVPGTHPFTAAEDEGIKPADGFSKGFSAYSPLLSSDEL